MLHLSAALCSKLTHRQVLASTLREAWSRYFGGHMPVSAWPLNPPLCCSAQITLIMASLKVLPVDGISDHNACVELQNAMEQSGY